MKTPAKMIRPTSAKELARTNPALAQQWGKFVTENKAELVRMISAKVSR